MKDCHKILDKLESAGLTRSLKNYSSDQLINFSSNDYLALSRHPEVIKAAITATADYGTSASASRLMSGNLDIHEQLEKELALFLGQQACLLFGSGFLNNIGILSALIGRDDQIFSDKLNHASLIDGTILSRAKVIRYKHNDLEDLEAALQKAPANTNKFIVTESVFSMDGDKADIDALIEISNKYQTTLIVDEAHAIGIFGAGLVKQSNKRAESLLVLGTLSKALASYGGFVACSEEIRSVLINKARSFIYSTALPPASCSAALAALNIIRNDQQIGSKVLSTAKKLHALINPLATSQLAFNSNIIPLITGSNKVTIKLSEDLLAENILCTAIRPPTVPDGTARLRFSICANHTESDLDKVAACLQRLI